MTIVHETEYIINNIDMKWQKGKKETLMKSLPNRDGRFKDICSGSKPQMGKKRICQQAALRWRSSDGAKENSYYGG